MFVDVIDVAGALIAVPSVTPSHIEGVDVVQDYLGSDFIPEYFNFVYSDSTINVDSRLSCGVMFSHFGSRSDKSLCFVGHLDVVPPGDGWSADPFVAREEEGFLIGRGASDMKSAVACFITAARRAIQDDVPLGRFSILLGGDEEGSSSMGRVVNLLLERSLRFDLCVVGEPTSAEVFGDTIKIGRRGSCNFLLEMNGRQSHVAYAKDEDNPLNNLSSAMKALQNIKLDDGNENFQPSRLVLTNVYSDNVGANNVTPSSASVRFNIRFNDIHTPSSLFSMVSASLHDSLGDKPYKLSHNATALPFISEPSGYLQIVKDAVYSVTGVVPAVSTSGGTSDARFVKDLGPIVEFGLLNTTAHAVDERVSVDDIRKLEDIYYKIICDVFR